MQEEKECYLCRYKFNMIGYDGDLSSEGLHRHHVIFGTAGRAKSEKWGLWCYVCEKEHHEHGEESPHQNKAVADLLAMEGQKAFERKYGHDLFMKEFGRSYAMECDYE